MLNTAFEKDSRPSSPVIYHIQTHHDTCLYFDCPDIFEDSRLLNAKGLNIKEPFVTGYKWNALEFSDHDSNGI